MDNGSFEGSYTELHRGQHDHGKARLVELANSPVFTVPHVLDLRW